MYVQNLALCALSEAVSALARARRRRRNARAAPSSVVIHAGGGVAHTTRHLRRETAQSPTVVRVKYHVAGWTEVDISIYFADIVHETMRHAAVPDIDGMPFSVFFSPPPDQQTAGEDRHTEQDNCSKARQQVDVESFMIFYKNVKKHRKT